MGERRLLWNIADTIAFFISFEKMLWASLLLSVYGSVVSIIWIATCSDLIAVFVFYVRQS